MAKRRGFTLIEVMVVMVIIAILATAGISSYSWYVKKAIDLKTTAVLAELESVTTQFRGDHNGRLPTKQELKDYIALHPISTETHLAIFSHILGIHTVFADAPILTHPAGNRSDCLGSSDGTAYFHTVLCEIVYYQFSDGKFAFSGGMLTKGALKNFHRGETVDGSRQTFGVFVGNSPIIGRPEIFLTSALSQYNIGRLSPTLLLFAESLTFISTPSTPSSTDISSSTDDNTSSTTETNTDPSAPSVTEIDSSLPTDETTTTYS